MANGRMITNLICRDKRVNQLSSDTGRLAFTWLITFADREGRVPGDPAIVKSMVFPRRQDVTIEQMEAIIQEWHALGLVVWYEAQDDKWIWFPKFDDNQKGLRKDREAPSKIPPPPEPMPEEVRQQSGVVTDQIPVKLIEVKSKEEKGKEEKGINDDSDATFTLFQQAIEGKGITLNGPDDITELTRLIADGVTQDDLLEGIKWRIANNKGKVVRYFNQITGPAQTAKTIRLQSGLNGPAKEFTAGEEGRVSL